MITIDIAFTKLKHNKPAFLALLCALSFLLPMNRAFIPDTPRTEKARVYFKCQVDDFAIACQEECKATIIFDAIDLELQIPIERQGLITLFNGLDVLQSQWYIKI